MTSEAVIAKGDDFTSRTTFHSGHRFNSLLELARFGANIAAQCDVPSSFAYGQLALCGPDTQPACETPVVGWFGASHRPQKTQGQLQYANLQPGNMLASQTDAADVLAAFNAKNDRQLDQLKRDVQETQSSEQPTESEPEPEPESAVVNSTEDLLRILRMDKSQLQAEQTDMVDRYRHRMPRRRQDQEQHPLVDILNGMAEGCPAASFVVGIIPDVREGVQDSDRQPIFVPIAFYNSRNDANVLLAAIRDRVPRLGMSLYVLPPGQLYVPARIDEVALSVHSASPEIDKMLTETRATDARTADLIEQSGLRKLVCGQFVNRLLQNRPEEETALQKTLAVLHGCAAEIGPAFDEECERHACTFLGLEPQETDAWLETRTLPDSFVKRIE